MAPTEGENHHILKKGKGILIEPGEKGFFSQIDNFAVFGNLKQIPVNFNQYYFHKIIKNHLQNI